MFEPRTTQRPAVGRSSALARAAALTLIATALGGCGVAERVLSTPTPGPSPTPTITPTPTPIPPPLAVLDELQSARASAPVARPGAPCGVVDTFDTPLAPPDGVGHGVRWPYGRSSRRYGGKFHAGEDWGSRNWRGNLGLPVYSIGHGEVILAQPLGWGRDQGVFIVRHTYDDGSRVLSFYGHLEPDSIVLRPGACVARGDQVGNIGNPRTSPHLHFEIRDHMANEPGPGYWPSDPSKAGWYPPTELIREVRVETSPGVVWTQDITSPLALAPGFAADGSFVSVEAGPSIVGRSAADGAVAWRSRLGLPAHDAVLDVDGRTLYIADRSGSVTAYSLPLPALMSEGAATDEIAPPQDGAPLQAWSKNIGRGTAATLAPLPSPGGGVVVHGAQRLVGLSRDGAELWAHDQVGAPFGWSMDGAQLVLAGSTLISPPTNSLSPAFALDPAASVRAVALDGRPAVVGDSVLVYRPDGVWRVPLGESLTGGGLSSGVPSGVQSAAAMNGSRLMALDPGTFDAGQIVGRDARAIIAHRGRSALRLFALDPEGRLLWDSEISALGRRLPLLMPTENRLLAATSDGDVLEIDPAQGTAHRLFDGILAEGAGTPPMAAARGDGSLVVVQVGSKLVALDPTAAAEWRTLRAE